MPVFNYRAMTSSGRTVSGEGAATSPEELSRELADRGLLVQQVRRKRGGFRLFARRGVSAEDFLLFNQEFMALLRAGLTVPEALAMTADRPEQPVLRGTLLRVLEEVRRGSLLSEACGRHPEVFDTLYLAALQTGEKTGDTASVLAGYQEYLRRRIALGKKISHALAYPAFLLVTLVVILAVLFIFVMPRFVQMYADFDAQLPLPTRILLNFVQHLYLYGPIAAAVVVAAWLSLRAWLRTPSGRERMDALKTNLPVLGGMSRLHAVAQTSRTLSTLLRGGTPLVDAMATAADAVSNRAFGRRLLSARQRVIDGENLASAMKEENLLPGTAVKMVEAGEASGNLEGLLADIAAYYEETLEHNMARATALIEPALMLLMGITVGGIIIVMYLPIFSMADIIQ
ncbi:MAG TPA: type II secretion system F family protein [Gammaproteobacteria bacterium]|nr:type II secretion system F family protein [Gammaproteobacteria bacterium]